jgi:hypothetical protein
VEGVNTERFWFTHIRALVEDNCDPCAILGRSAIYCGKWFLPPPVARWDEGEGSIWEDRKHLAMGL